MSDHALKVSLIKQRRSTRLYINEDHSIHERMLRVFGYDALIGHIPGKSTKFPVAQFSLEPDPVGKRRGHWCLHPNGRIWYRMAS